MLVAMALVIATSATPALAHAELKSSNPRRGASLSRPPQDVVIDFTEPPTASANVVVTDGCKRDVAGEIVTEATELRASLDDGEPGKWRVRFDVVSALDGHPTSDSFTFEVQGEPDCSRRAGPRAAPEEDEDSGALTLFLIFGGLALAAVGVAALARRRAP